LSKSEIAVCVAFLCHACEHQEVGAAVKRVLGEKNSLKSSIEHIIGYFGGDNFVDPKVESITIDDSYRVVVRVRWFKVLLKRKRYSLDW
jgi:hypothetical protein